jgi:hypothetical protein
MTLGTAREPSEMLVKVAHAISQNIGRSDWRDSIGAARAAVATLREPTTAMLKAATVGLADFGDLPDDWRVMIDHVLGENE